MEIVDDYGNAGREGVGSGDDELKMRSTKIWKRDTEGGGSGREGRESSSATKKMLIMNI